MATAGSKTSMSLLKRAWNEIPDIVAGTGLAIIGLVMTGIGAAVYYARDGNNRRYKLDYVVIRPDDPRAAKVHKD